MRTFTSKKCSCKSQIFLIKDLIKAKRLGFNHYNALMKKIQVGKVNLLML